ncbi:MAG: acyltransferase [Dysgonamonadaceae bacterium]|jgi:acetyltransferase-like isoleucine patch superfamily enzyme|nr:acyltransferase [Dysgonamonadaceae bacterium]
MNKIRKILSLNIFQFIYYNFFCKRIVRDKGCYIIPIRGAAFELHKRSKLILHANVLLNINKYTRSHAECYLRLRDGAEMIVTGNVNMYYGATIEVHVNGNLTIGQCHINTGAVIICAYKMKIGSGVLIARLVHIMDSDTHHVFDEDGNKTNIPKEVIIGDNVWLGVKSTILRGVTIGCGSIVSANSVVLNRVKEHVLVAGMPARVFSEVKDWRP